MSDRNYIHIMAFRTELDEDTPDKEPTHIDSIPEEGDWRNDVQAIINDNLPKYHAVFLEDDLGTDLSGFTFQE